MIKLPRGRKPLRLRTRRRTTRVLFEAVERRVMLCALHENGGHSVHIAFYDGTDAPLDLSVDPVESMAAVGPTLTPSPALFSPISGWQTAANGLPILNSLPGAPTAIYLDFDGDTASGSTAYSEDTDATTYNATEQTNIVEAWRQISAYFAMFDVNVTTAVTSLPKAWEVIGNNAGGSTGGYAYVGTFPNSAPEAFNASGNARTRQSGMAHELGHVFGLQHQSVYDALGNKTAEYLSAPDSLHGPIMGVDYSGSVHKWFIGHSATNATTMQDDMAVIASKIQAREPAGGDGYRHDDFGNTIATASALNDDPSGFQTASGIIERRNDVDAFSFVSNGGGVTLAAVPDAPSGVDLRLEVYDASGNLVAAKDGATNDQQMTLALPQGTYYAMLSSHGDYGDQGMYDFSVRSLPTGWTGADIGTVGTAGYSQYDAGTGLFTNAGAGSSVTGASDSFHFAYETLNGDGEIVARVTKNDNTNGGAKVGVEIRDTLANNARHAAMIVTPSGASQFISRGVAGGSSALFNGPSSPLPQWVRLVRAGTTFTGYTSSDGVNWTQVGQSNVTMGNTVYVGLLTSSLTTTKLDVGQLDSVAVTGDTTPAQPAYNALAAPTNLVATAAATGTGVTLSWDDVPDAVGFNVQRSSDGINYTQIATTAAGVLTYTDPNPGATMRYFYRVAARDGAATASAPSVPASALPRPPAPTGLSMISPSTSQLVVNWKDVSYETGYRIERSTDGVNFSTVTTVGPNTPFYVNSGLSAGVAYTYRVVTLSAVGDSAPSTTVIGVPRLAAVAGFGFNTVASNQIVFHWTDIANETGYRVERSTNGTNWSTLGTTTANVTTYTDNTVQPLKEYYYRVYGTTTAGGVSLDPSGYIFTATPDVNPLPSPWVSTDVGNVLGRGTTGYSNGTFTLISTGADINGTSDAFHYTYQTITGDATIVARVASIENTDTNAKVGVMMRIGTTTANAPYVAVLLTPGAGVSLQSRTTSGGNTAITAGPTTAAAPYWVKLTRINNVINGFVSSDGSNWTQIGGNFSLPVGASVTMGLASTSHTTNTLGTATVTSVTANVAPTIAANPAATPVNNQNRSTLTVTGADDAGEAGLTYTWTTVTVPAGAPAPTLSSNGSNDAKTTVAAFFQSGMYQFKVTITDAAGLSVTSGVLSVNVSLAVPPTVVTPAAATPNPVIDANSTALSVLGSDDVGESNLTYTWSLTTGPVGAPDPVFSVNGANAAKNTTVTFGKDGTYQFLVTVTDASGLSVTSSVSVDVSLAVAPTVATPAAATPNPVTTGLATALSVLGADDRGEAALTYTWSTLAAPDGAAAAIFSDNGTNAAKNVNATVGQLGTYTFKVVITDAAGLSVSSTVDVVFSQPVTPPQVTGFNFDDHNHLSVTFSQDVSQSLGADDLSVQSLSGGVPSNDAIAPTGVVWNADTKTATFTFATDFADGDYQATLSASGVFDPGDVHLAPGGPYDFFKLTGDANHDRSVDFNDLVKLAQNYNTTGGMTYASGDFNGDGNVDFNDLVILAQHYNSSLPDGGGGSPTPAASPATAAAIIASVAGTQTTTTPTPPAPPAKTPPKSTTKAKRPIPEPPAPPVKVAPKRPVFSKARIR